MALAIQPQSPVANNSLAIALWNQHKLPEAVVAFRKSIKLKPDFAEAYCYLGHALQEQEQFTDSWAAFLRALELGSGRPEWSYDSGVWVRRAEQFVRLSAKLPKSLSGDRQPRQMARSFVPWPGFAR